MVMMMELIAKFYSDKSPSQNQEENIKKNPESNFQDDKNNENNNS